MFKPGGLGRDLGLSIGWGEGAAGAGGPAAAGGGHWLLVGSEQLPDELMGSGKGHAGSAWRWSVRLGMRFDKARRPKGSCLGGGFEYRLSSRN